MEWIRVSAKTVEDAVMEAAIMLGTSTDGMEYNVIDKGSSGFLFGIGAKKAVIEARKKKSDEELMREVFGEEKNRQKKERKEKAPRQEKQEKASQVQKPARAENKPAKKENNKDTGKELNKENKKEAAPEKKGKETGKKTNAEEGQKKAAAAEQKKEKRPVKKDNREKDIREKAKEAPEKEAKQKQKAEIKPETKVESKPEVRPETEKTVPEEKKEREPRVPADPEVAKARAEGFLNQLFASIDMKVDVSAKFEEDTLSVDISGDDMGILIGKHGQTLDSLQYLTSLVVNKGNAAYVRVKLDTEDYRSRRKETLENLAKNIAGKVKRTGHPVFLEPMNPYERRIIHSALQNDEYVTTHSEGEEPARKVVITLRKGVEVPERRERSDRSRRGSRYGRSDRSERSGRFSRGTDRYSRSRYEDEQDDSSDGAPKPSRADLIAAGLIAAAGSEDTLTVDETDSLLNREAEEILESAEAEAATGRISVKEEYEETGESIEDIINSLDIHSPTGVVEKKPEEHSVDNIVKEISEDLASMRESAESEKEGESVSEVMEEIRKKYDLNQSEQ